MSRYAHFPQISSGVAFSDPWYDKDVWCQYRKEFQDSNWFMKMDTQEGYPGCVDILAVFGNPVVVRNVEPQMDAEGFAYRRPSHYKADSVELGIDSAKIFFGSYKDFQYFGESAALHTGGDGLCGNLIVLTVQGDETPVGFILAVSFDEDFVNAEAFFRQMVSSFEGKEISREKFLEGVDPKALANRILLGNELRMAGKNAEKGKGPEKTPQPPER